MNIDQRNRCKIKFTQALNSYICTHASVAIRKGAELNDKIGRQFRHFHFLSIVRIRNASPFHAKSIFQFLFTSLQCYFWFVFALFSLLPHSIQWNQMQYASNSKYIDNLQKEKSIRNLFFLFSLSQSVDILWLKCFRIMFENSSRFSVNTTKIVWPER